MNDPTEPLAWTTRAEEDYALAQSALRRKKPLTYGAAFHAQQCAEKYLKALLIARGQVPQDARSGRFKRLVQSERHLHPSRPGRLATPDRLRCASALSGRGSLRR